MPGPKLRIIPSEFLGLGPSHYQFPKLPRGCQFAGKFENHTADGTREWKGGNLGFCQQMEAWRHSFSLLPPYQTMCHQPWGQQETFGARALNCLTPLDFKNLIHILAVQAGLTLLQLCHMQTGAYSSCILLSLSEDLRNIAHLCNFVLLSFKTGIFYSLSDFNGNRKISSMDSMYQHAD